MVLEITRATVDIAALLALGIMESSTEKQKNKPPRKVICSSRV